MGVFVSFAGRNRNYFFYSFFNGMSRLFLMASSIHSEKYYITV